VNDGLKVAGDSNFFTRRMMRLVRMLFLFLVLFAGCGVRHNVTHKPVVEKL